MSLGLELALTGMGTVFIFLILLIFVTTFMSRMIHKVEQTTASTTQSAVQNSSSPVKTAQASHIPPELLTTIVTAAIHKHRSRNRD